MKFRTRMLLAGAFNVTLGFGLYKYHLMPFFHFSFSFPL